MLGTEYAEKNNSVLKDTMNICTMWYETQGITESGLCQIKNKACACHEILRIV